MAGYLAIVALAVFAVVTPILAIFRGRIFNYLLTGVFSVTLCGYLQAAVFNGKMGTLTGDAEVNYGEAKAPAASAVFTDVNLNLNAGFIWKVAVAEGVETVNAKYSYNGEAVEAELKVVGGKVTVEQKAFDLGEDITLTVGDETITFNFAFYAEAAIAAAGEDAAKVEGMLDATWKYAVAAAAIKA